MESNESKKFLTLEGLRHFLDKFTYEMAHNGPTNGTNNESSEVFEEDNSNE